MMNKDIHVPRIPKGCDQQGRHPEAAHAASEFQDKTYRKWYTFGDLLWSVALAAAILGFLGVVTGVLI